MHSRINPANHDQSEEVFVVFAAHTGVQPFAVVVEITHTPIAIATVLGSGFDVSPTYFAIEFIFLRLNDNSKIKSKNYPFALSSRSS